MPTTHNQSVSFTYALATSATSIPLILATAHATWPIATLSFLPFTMQPRTNFSFLTTLGNGGASWRYAAEACEGRISHQGPSVSRCRFESGMDLTTAMLSSAVEVRCVNHLFETF